MACVMVLGIFIKSVLNPYLSLGKAPRPNNIESVRAVNSNRPVNLDLLAFQFPLAAKSSILHRVTGIAMFVGVAFLLCALGMSLESEETFNQLLAYFDLGLVKFITWGILTALGYHAVAGVTHVLTEFGVADSKEGGRRTAMFNLIIGAVIAVLAGVWVW